MSLVAVTGATGYVGKFVVPELLRHRIALRALVRPTSDRTGFPPDVNWLTGNLDQDEALAALVQDADAVLHLAYAHVPGRYRGGEGGDLRGWLQSNLFGSFKLLLAAREAGVSQFIFLSSRAVFSATEPGRELDETHPTSPVTHYGAYKVAVEAMLRSFAAVEGMQTTTVRATGVYGRIWPVSRSKWWDLVTTIISGGTVSSSRGGTEVHGADVARAVRQLLAQPELKIERLHLSDLYVTRRQLVRLIRRAANVPGPLPPPPPTPPSNVLVCGQLPRLGIILGGLPALEETIADLVKAAQTAPH